MKLQPYRIVLNRSAEDDMEKIMRALGELFPSALLVVETWPLRPSLVLEVSLLNGQAAALSPADVEALLKRWLAKPTP